MGPFPQLHEEDIQQINRLMNDLLVRSEAQTALFVEKAGYLISQCGQTDRYNTTELATLAANAYNATQFMADRLEEPRFSSMYQQGQETSVLWLNIDENSLLVVLFRSALSVGMVRYYGSDIVKLIADQLVVAAQRSPDAGIDFADVNPSDVTVLFQRKSE